MPSTYDVRRPRVSATTPVGISNKTWPIVKNALAKNASVLLNPASSKNNVFTPQISDAANVFSSINPRYKLITKEGVGFCRFRSFYRKSVNSGRFLTLIHEVLINVREFNTAAPPPLFLLPASARSVA